MNDQVLEQLTAAREQLLDLTKRNRLLNFRPSKRTTIQVVDELPAQVWRTLVDEGKAMSFLAREEHELAEKFAGQTDSSAADDSPAPADAEVPGPAPKRSAAPEQASEPQDAASPEADVPASTPSADLAVAPEPAPGDDDSPATIETPPEPADASAAEPANPSGPAASEPPDADATENPEGQPVDSEAVEGEMFSLPDIRTALGGEGGELAKRYTDLFLQTWLGGEVLQTNLLRTYQEATSALEERGANLLFLALGFLQWRDPKDKDRVLKAPILLVPVHLDRTSARRRFKLSALDDDPVLNPCLAAMLQRDFRIELPALPDDLTEFDVDAFLARAGKAIEEQAGWEVLPEIFLGLFSFTKYLMYVDLDPSRWPAAQGLCEGPLLRAMCGDVAALGDSSDEVVGAREVDRTMAPEDVYQVLDADSSQQEAIHAARSGRNLVIEGPPGTGKSQTIANIIAECLAAGRTVLFVSEKMAALEVVKRRLDAVGLGDFCLELHSTKANRKSVTEELRRVLEKGRYRAPETETDARDLGKLKGQLGEYVQALHEPLEPAEVSPYRAMGRVALLADIPDVDCEIPGSQSWPPDERERNAELVRRLGRQMEAIWPIEEHPWRGARLRRADGPLRAKVSETLDALTQALDGATAAAGRIAELLGAAPAGTLTDAERLADAGRLVADSPEPPLRLRESDLWDRPPAELEKLLATARAAADREAALKPHYQAGAADGVYWEGIERRFKEDYNVWLFRWFKSDYRADKKTILGLAREGYRPSFQQMKADIGSLRQLQVLHDELKAGEEIGGQYFDQAWQGAETDCSAVEMLAAWLKAFREHVRAGRVGQAGVALAGDEQDRAPLAEQVDRLAGHLAAWDAALDALRGAAELRDDAFDPPAALAPTDALAERLGAMRENIEALVDWSHYQDALQTCELSSVAAFVRAARAAGVEPEELSLAFEKQVLRLLTRAALAEREALARFEGKSYESDRLKFARLDKQWVDQTGLRLRAKLAAQKPAAHLKAAESSQLGILQGEVRRKRGGRPIRKLLRDAAEAVARLKPCFMMSPLSIAQFIDPAGMRFDVVVFDEASQVEPADALGAIARGDQLLLVGDPKQLPPTSFFSNVGGEPTRPPRAGAAEISDMESILDRGSMVLPSLRLRWHYRSRHESLITFSNREFYDNSLVVFPSAHRGSDRLGLSLRHEPEDFSDRGQSQCNRAQARRIAEWVFEHARRTPDRSLGVGAFSRAQQQAILDEIEKLRRADESLEGFFDRNRPEPFFVKNLETIQGDERDVILLSVGYGKTASAGRLSMNFGPLNQDGGWRRLNVLITRAKEQCVVFSSIRGDDFDLGATEARGVHSLKGYLDYALSGRVPQAPRSEDDGESALERAVYNALTAEGVSVHRHVGCETLAIDLAVLDDEHEGRYLLGIECDGPGYRDAATTRDRDRTRQQVLEGLGWRIVRVWAPDWYQTPQRELKRILESIDKARKGRLAATFLGLGKGAPHPAELEEPEFEADPDGPAIETQPYRTYVDDGYKSPESFHTDPLERISELVRRIVDREGPIHEDELARRAAAAYELGRVSSRVKKRVADAANLPLKQGHVRQVGEFYWPGEMAHPPVRRRGEEDVRKIELICPEEIARAAGMLLEAQFGMPREDLVVQTARIFGYRTTGAKISERVDEVIGAELDAGRILAGEDGLLRAKPPEQEAPPADGDGPLQEGAADEAPDGTGAE